MRDGHMVKKNQIKGKKNKQKGEGRHFRQRGGEREERERFFFLFFASL